MLPCRSTSPEEYCLGVNPIYAPTVSDFSNLCGLSIAALYVIATIIPTPGTVVNNLQSSSFSPCSESILSSFLNDFSIASKLQTNASIELLLISSKLFIASCILKAKVSNFDPLPTMYLQQPSYCSNNLLFATH
ncbi:hypothetical protein WWILAPA82_05750 [Wolbachia pipientis]